jgi:hypothetical protein
MPSKSAAMRDLQLELAVSAPQLELAAPVLAEPTGT